MVKEEEERALYCNRTRHERDAAAIMSDAFLRWTYPFRPKDAFPEEEPERAERIYVSRGFSPGFDTGSRDETLGDAKRKPPFRNGIILSGRPPGGTVHGRLRRIGRSPSMLFVAMLASIGLVSSEPGPSGTLVSAADHQYPSLRGSSSEKTAFSYPDRNAGHADAVPPNLLTNRRMLTDHNKEENAAADSATGEKKKEGEGSSESYPTILHEQLKFNDNLDKPTLYYLIFALVFFILRKCICFPCRKICCKKKKKKNIEKMKFNDWEAWDDDEWEAFELAVTTPSPKDDPKSPKNKKKAAKEAKLKAKQDKQAKKEAKIKEKAAKKAEAEAKAKEKAAKKRSAGGD